MATNDNTYDGDPLGQSGLFSANLFEQMYDLSTSINNSVSTTQSLIDTIEDLKDSLEKKMSKPLDGLKKALSEKSFMKGQAAIRSLLGESGSIKRVVNNITNNYYSKNTGNVRKYNNGGFVSGPKGVDKVPAMLTDGEYVINAKSTGLLGSEFLDLINNYGKGYHKGGPVKAFLGTLIGAGRAGLGLGRILLPYLGPIIGTLGSFLGGAVTKLGASVIPLASPFIQKGLDLFTGAISKFNSAVVSFVKAIPKIIAAPFKIGLDIAKFGAKIGNEIKEQNNNIKQALSDTRQTIAMFARGRDFGSNRFLLNRGMRTRFAQENNLLTRTFGRGNEGLLNSINKTAENLINMGDYVETVGAGIFGDETKMIALQRAIGSLGLEAEDIFYNAQEASRNQEDIFTRLNKIINLNLRVSKQTGVDEKRLAKRFNEMRKDIINFGHLSDEALMNVSARMNKFAISAESANAVFSKFTDFESATKSAAVLSQTFGMSVDALKLIKAEDPMEIIEMMRDSFLETGKSFDSLSRFEKRVLESETGISSKTLKSILKYRRLGYSLEEAQKKAKEKDDPQARAAKATIALTKTIDTFNDTINTLIFDSPFDAMINQFKEMIQISDAGKGPFTALSQSLTNLGVAVTDPKVMSGINKTLEQVKKLSKPLIDAAKNDIDVLKTFINKDLPGTLDVLFSDDKNKRSDLGEHLKGIFNRYVLGEGGQGFQLGKTIYESGMKFFGFIIKGANSVQDPIFNQINKFLDETRSFFSGEKTFENLPNFKRVAEGVNSQLGLAEGEFIQTLEKLRDNVGKTGINIFGTAYEGAFAFFRGIKEQFADDTSFLNKEIMPIVDSIGVKFGKGIANGFMQGVLMLEDLSGGWLSTVIPGLTDETIQKMNDSLLSEKILGGYLSGGTLRGGPDNKIIALKKLQEQENLVNLNTPEEKLKRFRGGLNLAIAELAKKQSLDESAMRNPGLSASDRSFFEKRIKKTGAEIGMLKEIKELENFDKIEKALLSYKLFKDPGTQNKYDQSLYNKELLDKFNNKLNETLEKQTRVITESEKIDKKQQQKMLETHEKNGGKLNKIKNFAKDTAESVLGILNYVVAGGYFDLDPFSLFRSRPSMIEEMSFGEANKIVEKSNNRLISKIVDIQNIKIKEGLLRELKETGKNQQDTNKIDKILEQLNKPYYFNIADVLKSKTLKDYTFESLKIPAGDLQKALDSALDASTKLQNEQKFANDIKTYQKDFAEFLEKRQKIDLEYNEELKRKREDSPATQKIDITQPIMLDGKEIANSTLRIMRRQDGTYYIDKINDRTNNNSTTQNLKQ